MTWREDLATMKRLELVGKGMAGGYKTTELLEIVNRSIAKLFPDQPDGEVNPLGQPISMSQLLVDRQHVRELWREQIPKGIKEAKAEALARLEDTINKASRAFEQAQGASLNRSAYLSIIRTAIMDQAKINGLLQPDVLLFQQNNVSIDNIDVVVNGLKELLGSASAVAELTEKVRNERVGKKGRSVVIDVDARRVGGDPKEG